MRHWSTDGAAPADGAGLTDDISGNGGGNGTASKMVDDENEEEHYASLEDSWVPFGGMYFWKNSNHRDCMTVIVNLNSGAAKINTEDITLGVSQGGMELWVRTLYPQSLVSWDRAKRMYTNAHKAHPDFARRSIAHEDYLTSVVGKEGDQKYMTAYIELPFRVIETTDPEKDLQGDDFDNCRNLHVYLESFEEPTFKKAKINAVVFV